MPCRAVPCREGGGGLAGPVGVQSRRMVRKLCWSAEDCGADSRDASVQHVSSRPAPTVTDFTVGLAGHRPGQDRDVRSSLVNRVGNGHPDRVRQPLVVGAMSCSASSREEGLVDRALYLPADEERRLLTYVPDETAFATRPQLAAMLQCGRHPGHWARCLVGDEVYGGWELGHVARALGFHCALAVRSDHRVNTLADRFTATELAAPGCARAPTTG